MFGYELGYLIPYFKNWVCSSPELFIESGVVSKASFSDIPCCVLYNTGETPYLFKNPVSVCSSIEIDELFSLVEASRSTDELAATDELDAFCEAELACATLVELALATLIEAALLLDSAIFFLLSESALLSEIAFFLDSDLDDAFF